MTTLKTAARETWNLEVAKNKGGLRVSQTKRKLISMNRQKTTTTTTTTDTQMERAASFDLMRRRPLDRDTEGARPGSARA